VLFLSPIGVEVNPIQLHKNFEEIPMLYSVKWAIKNHGAERTNGRKRKEQLQAITAISSEDEH